MSLLVGGLAAITKETKTMKTVEKPRVFQKVTITESDYFAIMQWEDEGGKAVDVIYELVRNSEDPPNHAVSVYKNPRNGERRFKT